MQELERARQIAPDNPRVWLFSGINTLYKPSFVGGGAENALKELARSQELFAAATPASGDSLAPHWGPCDAWLWAGIAHTKLEQHAAARDAFAKALALDPANGWVRSRLLPEAEKALAAGKGKSQ
jgi:tetratricopeptide (TPR) repeat protein